MIDAIKRALAGQRYATSSEDELQFAIDGALVAAGLRFAREVRLNARDRLDFLVYPEPASVTDDLIDAPDGAVVDGRERTGDRWRPISGVGTAIEVKVDGSLAALTRQLHRYAQHDRVIDLVVITNRARLTQVPRELNGKRVEVISLLESAL